MKPDSKRIVYDGKFFDLAVERWGKHEREVVVHPGAVAVVAIDRDGGVWRELRAFFTTPDFCREDKRRRIGEKRE